MVTDKKFFLPIVPRGRDRPMICIDATGGRVCINPHFYPTFLIWVKPEADPGSPCRDYNTLRPPLRV